MSLKLVSLASGSKGNATLILSNTTAILVDAGISANRLAEELRQFGLTLSRLDGVVVTHEHSDHVKGLAKLCEYTDIYAHPRTQSALCEKCGDLKRLVQVEDYDGGFEIGDVKVLPFRIPHDAAYPLGYSFECHGARCSVATDIGVPTFGVLKNIKDSDVVLLEANYDVDMLKEGKYPRWLKERILSNVGHLSNGACARIVKHLCEDSAVKHILLGHISENNNTEQLAYDAVKNMLDECDSDIELHVAHQKTRSDVFEIV